MANTVTNELIYETLERMPDTLAVHTRYHLEARERLGHVETQLGGLNVAYANLSNRLGRVDERLARVQKRLDLHEA